MRPLTSLAAFFAFAVLMVLAEANDRPPIPHVPASSLIKKCKIAVLFNQNEQAVKESDLLDGVYCLGLVRGVLGTNEYLGLMNPLFCLPPEGMKAWQVAERLVRFAELHSELLNLSETEFTVRALRQSFPCRLPLPDATG